MSFGTGAFGVGPLGVPAATLPAEDPTTLTSSRKIDVSGAYVLNDEGGFVGMSDTVQRVQLAVAYAAGPHETVIDQRSLAARAARVRAALATMTAGPEPAIELQSVDVTRAAEGRVSTVVVFRDLLTNTTQTAEIRV